LISTEKGLPKFLLYSPLNQGLKPQAEIVVMDLIILFLLYSPLNQGLKHANELLVMDLICVFTLQSIKSRIETLKIAGTFQPSKGFLLYSPLNQGLKHWSLKDLITSNFSFYSTVH